MKDKIYFLVILFMFFVISVFFGLILIKDYKITQAPFGIIEINRLTGKVRIKQVDIESDKFYQSEINKHHRWFPELVEKIKMRKLTEQEEKEILRKCGVLYDLQYNQTGTSLLKEKNRFVRDCSINPYVLYEFMEQEVNNFFNMTDQEIHKFFKEFYLIH